MRAGQGDYVIVADHASNHIPPDVESPSELQNLGLQVDALDTHIAWDIGTHALAHALSDALETEAIVSSVSRLVVDKNRRLDQPGLMPDVSDGLAVPGNAGLSPSHIGRRIAQYYTPYHRAIEAAVAKRRAPVLLSLHSFTPQMEGVQRPWECGLLYNQDSRLAHRAIAYFETLGLCVGDNEPYPGNVYNATMDRHAEANGHPYLMLEIRNDLLLLESDIALWCARVVDLLEHLKS